MSDSETSLVRPTAPAEERPAGKSIPILMYHEISSTPHREFLKYTVSPTSFAAQMRWLAKHDYTTIVPDQLLAARAGSATLPARPVMLTFDDGFAESVRHAPPILASHGFTAVFYLVTGLAGATSRWIIPERGFELPLIGWSEARALESSGFHCESHTVSHPHLADISADACERELAESRQMMEQQLGRPVQHLAYPHGSHNASVISMAQAAGYRTACTTIIGLSRPTDSPFALRRVLVSGQHSMLDFASLVRRGVHLWDYAKQLLRVPRDW
jgi:peptidoglycan/xylan/chitin deacetylase (PgdA/CDA1 family)